MKSSGNTALDELFHLLYPAPRQRIMRVLFDLEPEALDLSQLARLTGHAKSTVRHHVPFLLGAALLLPDGKRYKLNATNPKLAPYRAILRTLDLLQEDFMQDQRAAVL